MGNQELEFLTPEEVADLLRVSKFTVYRLIESGKLPAKRISARLLRISKKDVLAYLNQADATKSQEPPD